MSFILSPPCSIGHFPTSRLEGSSPKLLMRALAVVTTSTWLFIYQIAQSSSCCWRWYLFCALLCSSHLCSVPSRWSDLWHWNCWFPNQDLGFEGANERGQLPRPLWSRHLHCFLREWLLFGHRLEQLVGLSCPSLMMKYTNIALCFCSRGSG